jgi:hypothetical protein
MKKESYAIIAVLLCISIAVLLFNTRLVKALPQSVKVALVPNASGLALNGGTLPTSGFPGGFSPTFQNVNPADIANPGLPDPIATGGFDTVVLVQIGLRYPPNPATYQAFQDYYNTSKPTFKNRIDNFVNNGGKLIIWDSECQQNDYSEFIYPFNVSSPGAMGSASGLIWIVENNTLSTNETTSLYYVNTASISGGWEIGDANVMTTYDPSWCSDMVCKNMLGTVGPIQTYAEYGKGLIIWNGLDMDPMPADGVIANDNNGGHNLNYIWFLQLLQPFNPSNLPQEVRTSGITVTPQNSTNPVGSIHQVTATVRDNLTNPIQNVTVMFKIVSGPNVGLTGTDVTDVNGEAHFSWTSAASGTDRINATATSPFNPNITIFDDKATKTWTAVPRPTVGGYSVSVQVDRSTIPLTFYAATIAVLSATFIEIKRKRHRK